MNDRRVKERGIRVTNVRATKIADKWMIRKYGLQTGNKTRVVPNGEENLIEVRWREGTNSYDLVYH